MEAEGIEHMPRPLSPLTEVLRDVMRRRGTRPATWRDAAADLAALGLVNLMAPAEVRLVRSTVNNMGQRGELRKAADVRVPGSRRPMTGWVMQEAGSGGPSDGTTCPAAMLQMALISWAR